VLFLCLQADKHGHFNRAAVWATDPADLLFAKWSNNRLVRFTDIYEAIRHYGDELDWEALVARARSCAIEDAAHASLLMTDRLLGPTAPDGVLQALAGRRRPRIRRALLAAVVGPGTSPSPRGFVASRWERLGHRRQQELFRLVGLLEVAFPGLRALRAEHATYSTLRLLALSAKQAASTVSRSVWFFLLARAGARLPDKPVRPGRSDA
jgi:hypothetical protein